jgi:acetyl/propionyl-CoA carboxylase alpha subunit
MRDAFSIDGEEHEVWLSREPAGGPARYRLHWGGESAPVALEPGHDGAARLRVGDDDVPVLLARRGDDLFVHLDGETWTLRHRHPLVRAAAAAHSHADDEVRAPMPGTVVSVHAVAGQAVARGDALLVMESMKLETTISAWRDGTVEAIHVSAGQTFERDAVLASLVAQED